MKQKHTWKQMLLLILSIVQVVMGVLTIVIGVFGLSTVEQLAVESGSDKDTATMGLWIIIAVGALTLLGGVFGIIASRNPAKTGPFLVITTIAFLLCAYAVYQSTKGGLLNMAFTGQGSISPTLIVICVMTAAMDALGYAIRNDYRKGN